jgi:microsomal dipeptidase-like Zn-dependent dipeptidase
MQRLVILLAAIVLLAAVGFFIVLAPIVDRRLNTVLRTGAAPPSVAAESLHRQLTIVDLHADALLWPRDLLARASHGHVDVPRLREGNVAIQVFSVVTKTPRGLNYDRNTAETDNITLLAAAQRYPLRAWRSLYERAVYQAAKLEDVERRSNGDLTIIRSSADLDAFLARRRVTPRLVGGILATEGLHPLEGRLDHLDSLAARGFRIFGLTHFFDNEVGGSAHGVSHGGLTEFGRQVISRMDSMSLIIDVAHASPKLIDDVLTASSRPIIVSHTGVQGTCPGPRNLTDDQLQRIAAKGGVVGIGYWDGAICEVTPASAAKAILHAVRVAGEDHVALGSDFDGSTKEPFNTAGLSQLTDALKTAGLTDSQIGKVMGGNALYVLRWLLPSR